MDLNVKGVFFTIQKFAPLLQKRASLAAPSRVVVNGSVAAVVSTSGGDASTFSYATSKAAVLHLTRNLAVELAPKGILVNAIAPGFFPSKMSNGLIEQSGGADAKAKGNPNQRLGRPEDVAAAVVFLCSRGAGHVNGDTVFLDGGGRLTARL
jgi:NAD(P)-dependent dehydrogenase (short-subunit alcohol dehydrogenase family)